MTNIYIDNEGDMESGIFQCVELAKLKGTKYITLAFPSEFMHKVFMVNLADVMEADNDVPKNVKIEATIVIPTEDDNNDESTYSG